MPPPCFNEACKRKSRALCHCCNQNLCRDHLNEHCDLPNSQLNYFVDEINTLADQLMVLNVEINDKHYKKLDKWRDDCYTMINHYYEKKHQELQERYMERVEKYGKEIDQIKEKINDLICEEEATHEDIPALKASINDIKHNIKQFEEKSIIVGTHPLIIDEDLIQIEKFTSNEIDISTLPPPFRTIDCSDEGCPVIASNNRYLLMDQCPNLYLYDKELTIVKETSWDYDIITDMCWSSTIDTFIIITEEDGVFLINEDMTLIEPIKTIEEEEWSSCTCSDAALYLLTNTPSSKIFQFNLLSSFNLIKQWNPPESCEEDALIYNIAYNNGTLALMINDKSNATISIELRSSSTLHRLWSSRLNLKTYSGQFMYRVCFLKCDEWLIIDNESLRLLHISKDGKLKTKKKYKPKPENAVLFGSNILAITTMKSVKFYKV